MQRFCFVYVQMWAIRLCFFEFHLVFVETFWAYVITTWRLECRLRYIFHKENGKCRTDIKNFNHVLSRELFLNSIMYMDIFVCEEISLEWSQHGISCRLKN